MPTITQLHSAILNALFHFAEYDRQYRVLHQRRQDTIIASAKAGGWLITTTCLLLVGDEANPLPYVDVVQLPPPHKWKV